MTTPEMRPSNTEVLPKGAAFVTVRIPLSLYADLRALARTEGVSATAAVEDAIHLWLTTYGDPVEMWAVERGLRPRKEPEYVD